MQPLTIGIIIAVYVLIIWGVIFYAWRQGLREWKSMRAKRIRRIPAHVMDKRRVTTSPDLEGEPITQSFITFDFEGIQKEFAVPEATYQSSRAGGDGIIILSGAQYKDFEPRSPGDEADDVYRRMVRS